MCQEDRCIDLDKDKELDFVKGKLNKNGEKVLSFHDIFSDYHFIDEKRDMTEVETYRFNNITFERIRIGNDFVDRMCQNDRCIDMDDKIGYENGKLYNHGLKIISFHDAFDFNDKEHKDNTNEFKEEMDEFDRDIKEDIDDFNVNLPFLKVQKKDGKLKVRMP